MFNIDVSEREVCVQSEYNLSFVNKAKRLGAVWKDKKKGWVFSRSIFKEVEKICMDCYGQSGEGIPETITLRLTYNVNSIASRKGCDVGGWQIVRALNRDGGAKVCSNVICKKGEFTSGGSRVNWETIIYAGAIFEVYDDSKRLLSKTKQSAERKSIDIEVVDESINYDSLNKENAECKKRLKEIDALLVS